jgi:hypothetical protein
VFKLFSRIVHDRAEITGGRGCRFHRRVGRHPSRGRGHQPIVERLEVRITPSTDVWLGADGSNWTDPANWADDIAPVAGDDLVFPATLDAGIVLLADGGALGDTSGVAIASGAGLDIGSGLTVGAPIASVQGTGTTGAGAIVSLGGASSMTGDITR